MNSVLEHVNAFWAAYGGWMATALIPTVIAGLTVSPKTKKAAGVVPKIWDTIKQLMGLLSVVTHKDQPGTFQMPLKLGKIAKKLKKNKQVPPAVMFFLIMFSISQANCAWWNKHGEQVEDVGVNCATVSIKDAAMNILPAVLAILSGGSVSWNEQLNAFAKQFGQDSVACALEFASNKLMAEAPMGVGSGSSESMEGVNKARSYMSSHHMKVKE